jgi:hypothetical protein
MRELDEETTTTWSTRSGSGGAWARRGSDRMIGGLEAVVRGRDDEATDGMAEW